MEDLVRVLRIVEITGPRSLVEKQVSNSLHGQREGAKNESGQVIIKAATIGNYPEILIHDAALEMAAEKSAKVPNGA